jgi:putative endonuclease
VPSGSGLRGPSPPTPHRQRAAGNTRGAGSKTERRARNHYRLRGYRILGENVWAAGYELDLIVRRGRNLVFCEVKGKSGTAYGDPLEMVTLEKARRIRRAAVTWLSANPEHGRCTIRFDVVAERGRQLERLAQAF